MVAKTRDVAVYRARQRQKFQEQRKAAIAAEKEARIRRRAEEREEFERQRAAVLAAEAERNKVKQQIRQCYAEHTPIQVMMARKMRRCSGGAVLPVYPGRRMCLAAEGEDRLADAI